MRSSSKSNALSFEKIESASTPPNSPAMSPTKQNPGNSAAEHRRKAASFGNWRQEVIEGGSLKRVDLETGSNGWASPPGNLFYLRGRNYFTKKQKEPSGDWLLQPAGVDWLRSSSRIDHVLSRSDNRVLCTLRRSQSLKSFVFAVNLQIPGREFHSAVFYFSTDDPIPSDSLFYRFVHGDDAFRNARFKIVNRIVKGPWIVKAAVGNYAACLLGRALTCRYHRGDNYLEIDVDIASSAIANAILHLALKYVTAVTIDMGFLVEAVEEEELPERLLGAVRVAQMELGSATEVEAPPLGPETPRSAVKGKGSCGRSNSKVNHYGCRDNGDDGDCKDS